MIKALKHIACWITEIVFLLVLLITSNLSFAFSPQIEISYDVNNYKCSVELEDHFKDQVIKYNYQDFYSSFSGVSVAENALNERFLINAAKGVGLTLKSASQVYKGTTRLGHALSKHAGRNPQIWGKIKGNPSTWHNQGLKHYNDIMNSPGKFNQVTNPNGIKFLEKRLPDGRGMRLNMDRTF